jgi:hypothetical protein
MIKISSKAAIYRIIQNTDPFCSDMQLIKESESWQILLLILSTRWEQRQRKSIAKSVY